MCREFETLAANSVAARVDDAALHRLPQSRSGTSLIRNPSFSGRNEDAETKDAPPGITVIRPRQPLTICGAAKRVLGPLAARPEEGIQSVAFNVMPWH